MKWRRRKLAVPPVPRPEGVWAQIASWRYRVPICEGTPIPVVGKGLDGHHLCYAHLDNWDAPLSADKKTLCGIEIPWPQYNQDGTENRYAIFFPEADPDRMCRRCLSALQRGAPAG